MNRILSLVGALAVSACAFGQAPYCASGVYGVVCGSGDEYITNVSSAALSQSGSCVVAPAYQDFTSAGPLLQQGVATPVTVTIGNYFSGDNVDVFCDWNSNNLLTDAGEHFVLTDGGSGVFSGTITPPVGAAASTRMRVTLGYYGAQDPCMAGEYYGAVWDFTVTTFTGTIPCSLSLSSPSGPGSVQMNHTPCPAVANDAYFVAFTFAAGTYPNGWFYGLDASFADLVTYYQAGYPFTGGLDATGAASFGPISGLPSGLHVWGVSTNWSPGYGHFISARPPITYTIP